MSRLDEALKQAGSRALAEGVADGDPSDDLREALEDAAISAPAWKFGVVEPREPDAEMFLVNEGARDGSAPAFHPFIREKLVIDDLAPKIFVEQFRRFGAQLHHAQLARGIRTLMVTSAIAKEGKTLAALNLALTLSHSYGWRVLLIDADLRTPSLHDMLQVPNVTGLSDVLRAGAHVKLPVRRILPTLWILTSGQPDGNALSILASEGTKRLVREASRKFDWVVMDTPPVGILTDANLLSTLTDAVVLVIRAASTPLPLITRSVEALGADRIVGVVLNRVDKL